MGRFFVLLFALNCSAAPGFITITLSPSGSIAVNQTFEVAFRLVDYTDQAEIDSFRFNVQWPTDLFALVPDSFNLGEGNGLNQQWLSKPNQESPFEGYVLSSFSEPTGAGAVRIHLRDTGTAQIESGTLANGGFLVSFQLRALAAGTGLIRAVPYNGATGAETFYGTAGTVLGVPQFSAISQTVLPNTRLSIGYSQNDLILSWPTNAAGFHPQSRAGLTPNISWNNLSATTTTSNGLNHVRVPRGARQLFFRLIKEAEDRSQGPGVRGQEEVAVRFSDP